MTINTHKAVKKAGSCALLFCAAIAVSASQCTGPTVVVNQPTPTATPTAKPTANPTRPTAGTPTRTQGGIDCKAFPTASVCRNKTTRPTANPVPQPQPQPQPQTAQIRFLVEMTGKCLGTLNGAAFTGSQIVQTTCNASRPDQLFVIRDLGGGTTNFQNAKSGLCVSVDNDARNGVLLIQRPCNVNDRSQRFDARDLDPSGDRFNIVFQHSGKCVDVPDGLPDENLEIIQWACDGSPQQVFRVTL